MEVVNILLLVRFQRTVEQFIDVFARRVKFSPKRFFERFCEPTVKVPIFDELAGSFTNLPGFPNQG